MSRYESKVILIIVVTQLFAVLRSRRKNKNLGKEALQLARGNHLGSECTEEQMKRQYIVALQKCLFNIGNWYYK